MTVQTPVAREADEPDGDDADGRVARRKRARRNRRLSGVAYGLAVALLALSIPALGVLGARAVLGSKDGEVVDPVLDPSEPGYRALIQPSPTMFLVQTDESGFMVGTAVLALASQEGDGGSVMLFPSSVAGDVPDVGAIAVDGAYTFSGPTAAVTTAAWALHLGIEDVVEMSPDDMAAYHEATGPLTIQNPDNIRLDDGTTFPAGPLELAPAEIPRYTAYLGAEESRLNRLLRQQLVWNAWVAQIVAAPTDPAFPGEQDAGLARFLVGLRAGAQRVENLPLVPNPEAEVAGSNEVFEIDQDLFQPMVPGLVPFPTGAAPGDRPRVRILAGTEDRSVIIPASRRVVAAGAQVDMVGNADEFGHQSTEIIYYDPAQRSAAEAVAEGLGFGTVTRIDEIDDTTDVIVVLGADAASEL